MKHKGIAKNDQTKKGNKMWKLIADYLITRAWHTPYNDLKNPDGTLYMARYWLVPESKVTWRRPIAWLLQRCGISVRIHQIADMDRDPALHDHPWNFLSVILSGGYVEVTPDTIDPCFCVGSMQGMLELFHYHKREVGSIKFKNACDRHKIISVKPDTYTLCIMSKKIQFWGFYTVNGKVWYKDYQTVHNTRGVR